MSYRCQQGKESNDKLDIERWLLQCSDCNWSYLWECSERPEQWNGRTTTIGWENSTLKLIKGRQSGKSIAAAEVHYLSNCSRAEDWWYSKWCWEKHSAKTKAQTTDKATFKRKGEDIMAEDSLGSLLNHLWLREGGKDETILRLPYAPNKWAFGCEVTKQWHAHTDCTKARSPHCLPVGLTLALTMGREQGPIRAR